MFHQINKMRIHLKHLKIIQALLLKMFNHQKIFVPEVFAFLVIMKKMISVVFVPSKYQHNGVFNP